MNPFGRSSSLLAARLFTDPAKARLLELSVSDTKRAVWVLEETCSVRDFAVREEGVVRVFEGFDRAEEFNRALVEAGVGVDSVHMSEENLEDHFVRLTGAGPEDGLPGSGEKKRRRWRR